MEKSMLVTRFDGEAPVIDGRLDETVWDQAETVDDLHQVSPIEYAETSERTEFRVIYDQEYLYVGARLWDSDPDGPTARILRQGENINSDDRIAIILDPFFDRRNGYRFEVNANGVREDILYQDNQMLRDWSGIWRAAATRDRDGWTAEVAIPFKTLSFDPEGDRWGINFVRFLARNNEWNGWVTRNRTASPSVAGVATGIGEIGEGLGLDVVPSVSFRDEKRFGSLAAGDSDVDPSLDAFYKLKAGLNGSLTINTDFSATEIDDRQVDLSRFSLFFPEKRAFFLKDSDIFEFGGLSGSGFGGPTFSRASRENGRPFFSRRIGLSAATGEAVDLKYGGKLSGRIGRWNIGSLAIRQDASAGVDATNLFVGRVAANVLAESSVGILATNGDPNSNLDNNVVGVDFRYRNSRMPGGRELRADAWYQQSDTEGLDGQDSAFGVRMYLPNRSGFRGGIGLKELEENFKPAMGFVNRQGIREKTLDLGQTRFLSSDYFLRSIFYGVDAQRIDRLDGGLQTEIITLRALELENHTRDTLRLRYVKNTEVLDRPFEISAGVIIPPGEYSFDEYGFELGTGSHRTLSGSLDYRTGDFFGGEHNMAKGEFTWSPSSHFRASVSYEIDDVELPEGDFIVRLATMRIGLIFSSKLSWVNLIQYDNVSETMGINSRLHWIPEAGREGFIVLNHSLEDRDRNDSFHSDHADLAIKFNYTFRF